MLVRLRRTVGVVGVLVGLVLVAGPAAAVIQPGPINPVALDGITSTQAILQGWTSSSGTALANGKTGWVVAGSTYFQDSTQPNGASKMSPGAGILREPYWDNVLSRWVITFAHTFPTGGAPPDNMVGWFGVNNATAYCSATAKGAPTATTASSTSGFLNWTQGPTYSHFVNVQPCPGARPYLQYITVNVYEGYEAGAPVIVQHGWYAGAYKAGGLVEKPPKEYCDVMHDAIPPGAGGSGFGFCAGAGGGAGGGGGGEWADLPDQEFIDAANFELACKDAPAAEWLSFSWLGPWIGHYAQCLFIPSAGFNAGKIQDSAKDSFLGPTTDMLSGSTNAVSVSSTCGVIAGADVAGTRLDVDTCKAPWNSFGTVRDILGIGLIAGSAIASAFMLARVFGLRASGGDDA